MTTLPFFKDMTQIDSAVARVEQEQENARIKAAQERMFEASEQAYGELELEMFEQSQQDVVEFDHSDFIKAIRTIILCRKPRSKTKFKYSYPQRLIKRNIQYINALSIVSDYFHENLLRVIQAGEPSHDQIRHMCNMVLVAPGVRNAKYSLTNAKNSPLLSFRPMSYIDARGTDLGWTTWGLVITQAGKKDVVIHLPTPNVDHHSDICDMIDQEAEVRQLTITCKSVKNYSYKLFDEA